MDCCTKGTSCPMQHRDDDGLQLTQSDADRCCASSEREDSTQQSVTSLVAVNPSRAFVTLETPSITELSRGGWRTHVPHPLSHVPTHVLLSVFVV